MKLAQLGYLDGHSRLHLPKQYTDLLGLATNDRVLITVDTDTNAIIIRPLNDEEQSPIRRTE